MALGLNIIVGFAGLLDLGYVAFFAIGAYTMGYFGSLFHIDANGGEGVHILVSGPAANLPGIHLNFLLIVVLAIVATTIAGMLIGLPTLRLRGDYIAIVTLAFGEIIGRIAINGDEIKGFGDDSSPHGRQGITPVDKIDLPFLEPFTVAQPQTVVLVRARARADRAVRELPPARLAPRPRVDRAARGRGRGASHGRPARQDEAAGLRHRRGVRRHLGRVPGLLPEHGQRRPVPVLVLDLRPRDDHPRRPRLDLGRRPRRGHRCRSSTTA